MSSKRVSSKRRIAHLQALCLAGLAVPDFIPALLEALHGVISSDRNLFDVTDEFGNFLHYFVERPVDTAIARLYFEHFHNRLEAECMPAFASIADMPMGVRRAADLSTRRFFNSALYQEIWKPQGMHTRMEGIVRDARGKLLGSLVLYRGPSDPAFSREDEIVLESVLPWIARGLIPSAIGPGLIPETARYVPAAEQAETLLLGAKGEVLSASPGGIGMLLLANVGLSPPSLLGVANEVDRAVRRLLELLRQSGESVVRRSAPQVLRTDLKTFTLINAHGRFLVEGRTLRSPWQPDAPEWSWTQVSLRRMEPHKVAVNRVLRELSLSTGQLSVSELLYQGLAAKQIAELQGVAPSTVTDHIRKIYGALDVRSVTELRSHIDAKINRTWDC